MEQLSRILAELGASVATITEVLISKGLVTAEEFEAIAERYMQQQGQR
jgi:hypothetical protein